MKVKALTTCALFAALLCICGPLTVPIGPVPVSLTNFVLYFAVMILGTRQSLISYAVYLLLGFVGLPVFSGFQGGIAKLAGPTGGYLIGFILMVPICGLVIAKRHKKPLFIMAGMFLGTIVAYAFGTAWFMVLMNCGVAYALTLCVWPFIPFDIAKIAIAVLLGANIRKRLVAAGILDITNEEI